MILIAGGTGFIGRHLCKKLAESGKDFSLLSRNPEKAKKVLNPPSPSSSPLEGEGSLGDEEEPVSCDGRSTGWGEGAKTVFAWEPLAGEPPLEAFQGITAVVNLAGETVGQRWNESVKKRIYESRILGTRNLVSAIKKINSKPQVLVNASAIGYYPDLGEKEITEETACGTNFLSHLCADWEAEAKKAEEFGVRVALLRIGIVLGLGGGALSQMLLPFKLGLGGPIGAGKQWFSWIHIQDVVGLILHAINNSSVRGAVNATAPEPVRNKEFSSALGKALHRPAFLPVPAFALKIVFGEFATEGLLSSQKVLPKKAMDFGYPFKFPALPQALKNLFP